MAWIQGGPGNVPQCFWSIFRWWHHTGATDVVNEHPWCESPITSHRKGDLVDWDLMTVQASTESSSCSRNQFETMWALWHGVLSCFKQLHGHTLGIKRWTLPATIFRYKLAFQQFSVCSKPLKSQMKKIPHTNISPPPAAWTVHAKQGASMVFNKIWLYHPNAKVESETHQTRQYFHNLWFWSARPDCRLS